MVDIEIGVPLPGNTCRHCVPCVDIHYSVVQHVEPQKEGNGTNWAGRQWGQCCLLHSVEKFRFHQNTV